MIEKRVSKMKMIDVCRQTELSERTVRYYVQRGLLHPISGEKGERTYMDFSSADVRRLEQVAALRKAGFSIEEILNMIQSPDTIPAIVMDRRHELAQTAQDVKMLLKAFDRLQSRDCRNMETLADTLSRVTASLSLPAQDAEPDFSRFEKASLEEKERALQEFESHHEKQLNRGRIIILSFIIIDGLLLLISFFLSWDLSLVFEIVFLVLLYKGYGFMRYIYAIIAGIHVLMNLYLLTGISFENVSSMNVLFFIFLTILPILFQLTTAIVFFTSKSVGEFMYSQRNG